MTARRALPRLRSARVALRPPTATSSSPSTVALGTAYELATASVLAQAPQYRLQGLVRVGGAGDQGVDLRGRWPCGPSAASPPVSHRSRPVIVQCKAESSSVGPSIVRELEGTLLSQARRTSPTSPTSIGILVTLSGFSEAAIRQARASTLPLALLHLAVRDVREMVRTAGRGGGVALVSASRNRALEELLRTDASEVEEGEETFGAAPG